MLKNLSFKLLECCFDDLGIMGPGVVVEQDDFTLSIGSFQQNSHTNTVKLGNVDLLVDSSISFEHFPVHRSFPVSPNANHDLF